MTAQLVVDPDDPTPPFEQIRRQLADLIDGGVLAPGDRLPPLRQLAADLGLAVGTVARAYRELEEAGLLESRRGGGTRVSTRVRQRTLSDRLGELAVGSVTAARGLGCADADIDHAVRRAISTHSTSVTPPRDLSARATELP